MARERHRRTQSNDVAMAAAPIDLTRPSDARYAATVIQMSKAESQNSWRWYDQLGEIHYGVSRSAKVGGYAELGVYELGKNGQLGKQVTTGLPGEIAAMLYSPYGGQRGLIERFLTLMKIPADSYLIQTMNGEEQDGFDFVSASELKVDDPTTLFDQTQGTKISRITMPAKSRWSETEMDERITPAEFLGRVWKPSSQFVDMPDSALKALDSTCEMLYLLTVGLRSKLLSRLASNGIMYIPNEVNDVRSAAPSGEPGEFHNNKVLNELLNAGFYSARNPSAPEAAMPVFMTGPGIHGEQFRHIIMDQEVYETDMKLRSELIDRILTGLDVQPSQVKGSQDANHWCNDEQTEVFTRRGWQTIDTIRVGDEALALDHETGIAEWQPVTDLYVADVVDEPMRLLRSRTHTSQTTMSHRWPIVTNDGLRRWKTTAELNQGHAITTGAPVKLPTYAKWTDALVEIAAWFWTEGNIGMSTTIAQSHTRNPERVDRIRAALTAEFGVDGFTERIQPNDSSFGGPITVFRLRSYARDALLEVAPGKQVTAEFIDSLTAAQLNLFIDVSCMGDGTHWRVGVRDIWQRRRDDLEAFERACILAGYAVSSIPGHSGGWVALAKKATRVKPIKAVGEMQRQGKEGGATDEIVSHTGRVWCPTVAVHHSYLARRDGQTFFTGNSSWSASEDELRVSVRPDLDTLCWALTRLVLWKRLQDSGFSPGRVQKYVVSYDLSKAQSHQNIAEDARQLNDRLVIGPAATREASGFEERHAPTDIEYIRAVGVKANDVYLATYGMSEAEKFDWTKIGSAKTGPNADSPADESRVQPGKGNPGSPGDNKSKTPARLRPA